jgi:hypothetical protein
VVAVRPVRAGTTSHALAARCARTCCVGTEGVEAGDTGGTRCVGAETGGTGGICSTCVPGAVGYVGICRSDGVADRHDPDGAAVERSRRPQHRGRPSRGPRGRGGCAGDAALDPTLTFIVGPVRTGEWRARGDHRNGVRRCRRQ